MLFQNVAIESLVYELPQQRITSAQLEDQIAETMNRLGVPLGRIEDLAGIRERRFWEPGALSSEVGTRAARAAIEQAGIDPAQLGCMINTSIWRDFLEPSTACLIHGNLGLPPTCINYDVSNACLGFMTGMINVGMMIEAGLITHGLVVCGDSARDVVETTIKRLQDPNVTPQVFRDNFATLTIGSSAVAMVLCHRNYSRTGHRINGAVTLAATEHNRLCIGDREYMKTDASALLVAGVKLAAATWQLAQEQLPNFSDEQIALYAPHQVGSRHTAAVVQALGLTGSKFYLNFMTLGNLGPAAVPISLAQAVEAGKVKSGDQIALFGIGSGINCSLMSVTW
ncbi:MAG: 3-oxoacyl-ACP synthase III [Roseiflexaceae bacterium]